MKSSKITRIWTTVIAVVSILAIAVSYVLTGPLYTVMNMYFGKGDAVVKNNPEAANLDSDYYKPVHSDAESLTAAGIELAERVEAE